MRESEYEANLELARRIQHPRHVPVYEPPRREVHALDLILAAIIGAVLGTLIALAI